MNTADKQKPHKQNRLNPYATYSSSLPSQTQNYAASRGYVSLAEFLCLREDYFCFLKAVSNSSPLTQPWKNCLFFFFFFSPSPNTRIDKIFVSGSLSHLHNPTYSSKSEVSFPSGVICSKSNSLIMFCT